MKAFCGSTGTGAKVFTHPPQKLIANRMLLEAVADCVNTLNDDKDQFS